MNIHAIVNSEGHSSEEDGLTAGAADAALPAPSCDEKQLMRPKAAQKEGGNCTATFRLRAIATKCHPAPDPRETPVHVVHAIVPAQKKTKKPATQT